MAYIDFRIVVEVATVQRLRVHPPPLGQFDQRHGTPGANQPEEARWGHLDADVGVLADTQQMRALVTHDFRAPHRIAQTALVQNRDVQRTVVCQKAWLAAQSSPDALLHCGTAQDLREQPVRVAWRLQQSGNDSLLILPQGDRLGIHPRPPLEPVRVLHLRIPVDPPPQPQQHSPRPQQLVALLGEGVLWHAGARLHAGHLRAVARDLVRQALLREARRLPEVPQHLPEHGGVGGCRSTLCIASSSAHRIPLGARR